jgi:hypothetical protein
MSLYDLSGNFEGGRCVHQEGYNKTNSDKNNM